MTRSPTRRASKASPRFAVLDKWLLIMEATLVWSRESDGVTTEEWALEGAIAPLLVQRFSGTQKPPWRVYTPYPEPKEQWVPLEDAEHRLRLLPPSGVDEDGTRGVVRWKREGGDYFRDLGPAWLSRGGEMVELFERRWVSSGQAEHYAKIHGHEFD